MTIREYAKKFDHVIVGKLTRHPEWEKRKGERWYMDEENNEYMNYHGSCLIITKDGGCL